MIEQLVIGSPKRRPEDGWHGFFPYYAGFPETFARNLISSAGLPTGSVVLDPWNGSGTTTFAAAHLGLVSRGLDLNPVMIIVARARLLPPREADSIEPLATEVTRGARPAYSPDRGDPLNLWFGTCTAAQVRGIEKSIRRHLVGRMTIASDGTHLDRISALAAAFYVALFAVCRELAAAFQSSNPTWLRVPHDHEPRVDTTREWIVRRLKEHLRSMAAALMTRPACLEGHDATLSRSDIRLADTTRAVIDSNSVDFILSSPPYCTRIDYTAATRIELAILSPLLDTPVDNITRQMIGSTFQPRHEIETSSDWGTTCNAFLEKVFLHKSKASSGYYYRTHIDYFDKMERSLRNLTSALKKHGSAILVVQDSYYKELHNDLPRVICEMGENAGLSLVRREDFQHRRSMARVNPYSRVYERPDRAIESVLCFRKV